MGLLREVVLLFIKLFAIQCKFIRTYILQINCSKIFSLTLFQHQTSNKQRRQAKRSIAWYVLHGYMSPAPEIPTLHFPEESPYLGVISFSHSHLAPHSCQTVARVLEIF